MASAVQIYALMLNDRVANKRRTYLRGILAKASNVHRQLLANDDPAYHL
jgi:hypothetical protein